MNYCYIENGIIVDGPRALPKSWRNISGLDWLSQSELKRLGWLPVETVEGVRGDIRDGSSFQIRSDDVLETMTWREFTAEEREEADRIQSRHVRNRRNEFLRDCDWTRLDDAVLSSEKRVEWATYRQLLRDVTDQDGFPHDINWPTPPA